ncbi:MAG: peptidoglycan DD-metalloendopeptidase family protein [Erysipelotrichaceae bacterium]|nr:peptidoglycan DD-metalloendopeptidase family protein [Erysipelotrichaceae bacterium]
MFRKLFSIILIVFMVLPLCSKTSFIYADEDDYDDYEDEGEVYEEEEKSDYEKCVYDKDRDACRAIARNAQNNLKEIEDQIAAAKNDREAAAALANEYAQKAEAMQGEIDDLKIKIDDLKMRIEKLENQIAENEAKVEALNTRVRNRMAETQKTMHFNGYLEFILGSKSFTDMLSRVYGVEAIVSKDKSDREVLLDTIQQLTADKIELDASKKELDVSYEEIVAKQAALIEMQEFYEEEELRIANELDEMTEARDNIYNTFDDLRDALKATGVTVSDGFVAAVHNSWISATVWNYGADLGGAWHLGVDYAASRGREIHAPAGGVVIRADDSCGDPGYLGNACGAWISGGGNQVYMMCEVDGRIYGIIFFHLHDVYVSYGDYLLQDDVIGTVGSSGSSTGPHCHIEMYYLGSGELLDYLTMGWNATFSVGRGATAYYNRCEAGNSAPCILNPELYLPAN